MSEHNANRDLADTARMRGLDALRDDPLERTQRMPVVEQRKRQTEALCHQWAAWPVHPLEDTQRMTIISRRMRRDEALKLWPMSPKVKP